MGGSQMAKSGFNSRQLPPDIDQVGGHHVIILNINLYISQTSCVVFCYVHLRVNLNELILVRKLQKLKNG